MASLLISFCNIFPRGLALGGYDFDRHRLRWVDLSAVGEEVSGVTGLAAHGGAYWCLAQLPPNGTSALLKIDHDLNLRHIWRLEQAHDAHSLVPFEDGLLVNDTGGNRVIRIEIPSDGRALREVEYWRYCDEQTDVVHVNSVAQLNGQVFVSMFGQKPENSWKLARSGKIVNITTNQTVFAGVFHPHSLINVGDTLYWLESNGGRIHRFSDRSGHEVVGELQGYLRGMAYDAEHFYIAASAVRRRSKSTGTVNRLGPLTSGEINSWIYRTSLENPGREVERRMLTAFGSEVFDLLLLDDEYVEAQEEGIDSVVQRVWRAEDQYIEANLERERLAADAGDALDQLNERVHQVEQLQRDLTHLQVDRECALEQIRQQEVRLQRQTHQLEELQKDFDYVCRDLGALRHTWTVRVSSALGMLGKRVLRKTPRPEPSRKQ